MDERVASMTDTWEKMILSVLKKHNVLSANKVFGVVTRVINSKAVRVYLEHEKREEIINCSPNAELKVGDTVMVEYINNNPKDKFIMAIINSIPSQPPEEPLDYRDLPSEPVRIARDTLTRKAYQFFYGEMENPPELQWNQELIRHHETDKLIAVRSNYPDGISITRFLIYDNGGMLEWYR